MARTLSDEDIEAVAQRVVALIRGKFESSIDPAAIYTTAEAAPLVRMHPKTLARKIRAGLLRAKGGHYRIRGSELLKLA